MQGVELGEGRFIDVVNVFYKYYHNLVLVKVCSFVRLVCLLPIARLTSFLRKYLPNVIDKFSCSLFPCKWGKVRNLFALGTRRAIIVTFQTLLGFFSSVILVCSHRRSFWN